MIESWLWVGYKVFKERGGREMKEKDKGILFVFVNYFGKFIYKIIWNFLRGCVGLLGIVSCLIFINLIYWF